MLLLTMCVPLQATRMLLASLEYGDDALLGHLFSNCELIGWLTSAPEEVVPTPAPTATTEAESVAAAEPADGGGGSNGPAAGGSAGGNSGGSGGKFPAGGSTPGRKSPAQSSSKDSTPREAVPAGRTSRPCSCCGWPGSCQLISGVLPVSPATQSAFGTCTADIALCQVGGRNSNPQKHGCCVSVQASPGRRCGRATWGTSRWWPTAWRARRGGGAPSSATWTKATPGPPFWEAP